jgi:hypothetical protein
MRPSSMAGHVARPVGQCLACYRLNQVSNSSWDSYKYPMPMEFNTHIHTHHILEIPLVKLLFLVY